MTTGTGQVLNDAQRAKLQQLLHAQGIRTSGPPAPVRVPHRDAIPLSYGQQRLWFLAELDPASAAYNVPCCLRLRGPLAIVALRQTLDALVRRHEILRTRFVEQQGEPVQCVEPPAAVPLPIVDLSALPDPERVARRWVEQEARRPFDLRRGPLLRARLVRVGADDHLWLMAMHHSICDGASVGILVRELSELYRAFAADRAPRLPEPLLQYADYTIWQRQRLSAERLQQQLAYWRQRLDGLEPAQLPTDRARSDVATHPSGRTLFQVPPALTRRLREVGRTEGVSLFMLVATGLHLLLARSCEQQDIAIGTVVANRPHRELESLIGFFVNALVLRARVRPEMTVRELLHAVREATLEAFANQDVPFERLVEELSPDRQSGRAPFFQVLFTFQTLPVRRLDLPGIDVSLHPVAVGHAKYELNLSVSDIAGELSGFLEYAADLFDDSTIVRLLAQLWTLLGAAISDPGRPVGEIEWLTEEERQRVIAASTRTSRRFPDLHRVDDMIAAQAARRPDAIAVVIGTQHLSYAELGRRARQLGEALQRHGVTTESPVVLCLERSLELVTAMLGVWHAGGAYVPIDPSLPAERIRRLVADANPPVVLTLSATAPPLPDGRAVLALDRDWPQIAAATGPGPRPARDADTLAYVMYTSGSTGRPKAVGISHGALANHMWWMHEEFQLTESDVFLQKTTATFDASVFEFYAPLVSGGRLALADPGEHRDPEQLIARIRQQQATMTQFVPSMLTEVARTAGFERCGSLRLLFVGGEAFPRRLAEHVLARLPVCLANMYGPTEVTIVSTHWSGRRVTPRGVDVPIGRPIANLQAFVLDPEGHPLPVGVPGELYLGGAGLGRGYLGQPALTADRFVPDASSGGAGARLYRSGDRARWRADGVLEYLGRRDQQIKIRGHRLELGEVESALGQLPGIHACHVLCQPDPHGSTRLVAYVTSDEREPASRLAARWRVALHAQLPEYMVPSAFVVLATWPRTPNGKLDWRALPPPDAAVAVPADDTVPPREGVEQLIAATWAQVLQRDDIGRHDSFFALGGHSLLATQVLSRLRAIFDVDLPLRTLFDTPTVAGLGAWLEQARRASAPPAPPVTPVPRPAEGLPLSYAQQRLWFLAQLDPDSPLYIIPYALRLRGDLDERALARSLQGLGARHEVLRTRFVTHTDGARQQIDPDCRLTLPLIDLRSLSARDRERVAQRIAVADARRVFDLSRAPLVRARLVRLADDDRVLIVTMHHIVSDGWSLAIVIRELRALYEALRDDRPVPLADLPIQYADVAAWQRQWLSGDILDGQLAYWRAQLDGLRPLALPTDRPRPAIASPRTGVVRFTADADLTRGLLDLSRREGVTLFMTLLAAFAAVLGRWASQDEVAIGTDVANRSRLETEGLIGFFVNQLVLRVPLQHDPSFRALLARVRQLALDAYAHQDVPFERIVSALAPARDLSRAPLFQATLVLQNAPVERLQLGDVSVEAIAAQTAAADTDLTLIVRESEGGLIGTLQYATDLFDPSTAERLLRQFQHLAAQAVAQPDAPLRTLSLLDASETAQVLDLGTGPIVAYPDALCLHDLVAAAAARTPEAIALVGTTHVSYRELQARAAQLAAFLRQEGAGPGTRVAICLERSVELIVGLLAILTAGAAYVPLDPEYPEDRLTFMCEDASPRLLLVHAATAARTPRLRTRLIDLDRDWPLIARAQQPRREVDVDTLAYVTYTSGSTGRPKGAMNAHRAVRNRLLWLRDALGIGPGDRMLQKTSITFDVSVGEIFGTLASGACLVLAMSGGHRDAEYLAGLMASERITLVHFVPSMLDAFLGAADPGACTSLRGVLCSGEALGREAVRQVHARLGVEVCNLYGPTETAIEVTLWRSDRHGAVPERIPVGKPIANVRLYVLDEEGRPQPVGVPGHLWIGGIAVGRGYLQLPGLTAERFRPDPHALTPGACMYATGDLARWLATGDLDYLGRSDRQIKIRGVRIEPGEIENALRAQADVREAAVVLREDEPGHPRLVAYVVGPPVAMAHDRVAAWLDALRRLLPDYMLPSAIVPMAALPVVPSGKLDWRALPAPVPGPRAAAAGAPQTPTEAILCRVWQQVLRLETIDTHDNFFGLGGDSILSVQIVARARAEGLHLSVRDMFEHQTIAALARAARPTTTADAEPEPPIASTSLTPMQRWLLETSPRAPHHHNQAIWLRPARQVTPALAARAIARLLVHHEALRLRVYHDGDHWRQDVWPAGEHVTFSSIDLRALTPAAQARARARAVQAWHASLDLTRGPLVRVAWFSTSLDEPEQLFVLLHHLCVDGLSWRILLEDLEHACRVRPLPPGTTSFLRWADAVAAHVSSPASHGESEYWETQLQAGPGAAPPRDSSDGLNTVGSAASVAFTLTAGAWSTVAAIEDLLLTALARACGLCANTDEVVIALEGHGREDAISVRDVSRTVGLFTVSYPIRLPTRAPDPASHLRMVIARRAAVPGRGTGFGAWRERTAHQPEISFNYLGQVAAVLDDTRLLSPIAADTGPSQPADERRAHVLHVTAYMNGPTLHGAIVYSTNQYERDTIERFAAAYVDALRALVTIAEPSDPDAVNLPPDLDDILLHVSVQTD